MSQTQTVTCPYDDSAIGTVPTHDAEAVEAALCSAYAIARDRQQWMDVPQRVSILNRCAELMAEQQEALALQAASEGGKPLADSQVEVARAIDGVRLAIEHIRHHSGQLIPMQGTAAGKNKTAFTRREPIGVVVAVSAFNHPLNLIVHQVVAAIAAGCPVIVKPAQDTPLSCHALVQILHQAGLPSEWCQFVLPQDHSLAEKLVTDARVAFFSFIGSARVGWMLRSKLAAGTRCALEHGGVAPLILAADADMDRALTSIAKGGFYHAGQVCVSVQRVFAHESIAREFAEQLAQRAKQLKVGDPRLAETEVGPLIRPAEVERIDSWVQSAIAAGAEALSGAEAMANHCYAPTVLWNPPQECEVSQQEVFGPVVCVYPYEDIETALAAANALPFSFQAAVFTKDIDTAMHVFNRVDASAVMVNEHTAFRVDGMPFAGLRQSGLGVGGIGHTIDDMQIEKMMVLHSEWL